MGDVVFGYWWTYLRSRKGNRKFRVEDIDPSFFTHIAYAFFGIEETGGIKSLNTKDDFQLGYVRKTVELKKKNPKLKILASVGGWEVSSEIFSKIAGDQKKRTTFVNSVLHFLRFHNFDGLDIDWNYPNQHGGNVNDVQNFITLLKELKKEFNNKFLLTVAVGAGRETATKSYNISELSATVDLINLITYDFYLEKKLNYNAAVEGPEFIDSKCTNTNCDHQKCDNIINAVNYWINEGASPSKLVLGIPLHIHSFAHSDGSVKENSNPYTMKNCVLGYNELCKVMKKQNWTLDWDRNTDLWISHDKLKIVKLKMEFIKEKKLAGAMVWSLESDVYRETLTGLKIPVQNNNNLSYNEKLLYVNIFLGQLILTALGINYGLS